MATNAEVIEYLKSTTFPAHRDDIVKDAEQAGAPEDVVKALRAMPPVEYADKDEVGRSTQTQSGPDQGAGHRAAQARDKKHTEVAQHLRDA